MFYGVISGSVGNRSVSNVIVLGVKRMSKDRTVDALFRIWIEGMYIMFTDIRWELEKLHAAGGSKFRDIVNDVVLGMIEDQDKWIPSDNKEDILQKKKEVVEYLHPLKMAVLKFLSKFPDIDENELGGITLELSTIFGSIQTVPTMFSYAYIKDKIGENKSLLKNIIFSDDKDGNVQMLMFWKYIIKRFAIKILEKLDYSSPKTNEYPICFLRLEEILTRTFMNFRNSEIQAYSMEELSVEYARPVDEAIKRFIRHVEQWMVYHEDIDEAKSKVSLDFLEKLKILADFYYSLLPATIAMSFENEE